MSGVCVLCPTRGRPKELRRLADSIHATSKVAVLRYYLDIDEAQYAEWNWGADWKRENGALFANGWRGPRLGPVGSANKLVQDNPGFDAYGLITDDSIVTTPGWDEWLLEVIGQFPKRIAVVSPFHNQGGHVDMPFVSKEWIEATGWFAHPDFYHYCWPIVTGLIGEMTAICHAPEHRFAIEHDYEEGTHPDRREGDIATFFTVASSRMPLVVERVRKAMA